MGGCEGEVCEAGDGRNIESKGFFILSFRGFAQNTQIGIDKELTPKTFRHVVRAYKRGEDADRIFERIGLAPDSRKVADEVYSRLARRGV